MSDKNKNVMKPDWRRVKFGDVVRQCKEKADPETSGLERYIAGEHMDTDDLRLRRWGEIGSGYLGPAFHMRFKPGQVLYGSRRTYLRKVAIADFDGICANTTFVLEPKSPRELLPTFLPFLMQTDAFNNFSIKNSKGSVNPYINYSDLAQFEFALPPEDEQVRFVEMLTATENVMAAHDDVVNHVARFGRSLLADVLSREWPIVDLGSVIQGTQYGLSINAGSEGQYPMLRMMNIEDGRCVENDIKYVDLNNKDFEAYRLIHGDVLFNRTNSYELVGRTGVYELQGDHVFASYLVRIKTNLEKLEPKFLTLYLNSDFGRRQVLAYATKAVSQANVNASNLLRVRLPLPPLEIQQQLLKEMASAMSAEQAAAVRRSSAAEMKKQLLAEIAGGVE
ncbi:restriction endonuclease subunit S [Pseudomonas putida]|uniref:restriction endonuclease subunit S n=1 Tax=Pseudomonas putida TaxID=303 RepID=UPI0023667599|nr:restriction endonuclease subunit S [Pseudomonas putida]MDD2046232.1 restriction endonuclease subunit S [Pseudomonas putida]